MDVIGFGAQCLSWAEAGFLGYEQCGHVAAHGADAKA